MLGLILTKVSKTVQAQGRSLADRVGGNQQQGLKNNKNPNGKNQEAADLLLEALQERIESFMVSLKLETKKRKTQITLREVRTFISVNEGDIAK